MRSSRSTPIAEIRAAQSLAEEAKLLVRTSADHADVLEVTDPAIVLLAELATGTSYTPRDVIRRVLPVASEVAIITALNTQIDRLGAVVGEHFGRHRDAEIYLSQPGLGLILGTRILGEFGDDPHRYADAKSRKNYAGTSPVTKAAGTKELVLAATPATAGSATHSSNGPSAHCADPRSKGLIRVAPRRKIGHDGKQASADTSQKDQWRCSNPTPIMDPSPPSTAASRHPRITSKPTTARDSVSRCR